MKLIRFLFLFLIICTTNMFLLSCRNKNNQFSNENINQSLEFVNYDSIYAYNRIQKMEEFVFLDSLREFYKYKSIDYKKQILESLNINSIPYFKGYNYENPAEELKTILCTGDQRRYNTFMMTEMSLHLDYNYLSYSLYMAENYKSNSAYRDVWYYLFNQSRKNIPKPQDQRYKERTLSLEGGSEEEKYLALYSLIKASQMGDRIALNFLSEYFEQGLYLPKDTFTASKLYEISMIQ